MLFHVPDSAYATELRFVSDLQDSLLAGLEAVSAKPTDLAAWVSGLPKWDSLPAAWIKANFSRANSYWGARISNLLDAPKVERQTWRTLAQGHRRFPELYIATAQTHRLDGREWNQGNLDLLREVLIGFYDTDIPIPTPTPSDPTAHRWLKFTDVRMDFSKKISVCPYTGESLKISGIQLDHFLPKSLFPILSCDPDNLVPCVGAGNRVGQKGETPPITLGATHQGADWFHPRVRPGLQNGRPDRVCLEINFPPTGQASLCLVAIGDGTRAQIENLEKLFHLSHDWTFGLPSRLEEWNKEIIEQWRDQQLPPTTGAIITVIKGAIKPKQRRRFIEPDAFIDAAVLEGISSDPAQVADLVRRAKSLE